MLIILNYTIYIVHIIYHFLWTARPLASELPKLCHCLSAAPNIVVALKISYFNYDNLELYYVLYIFFSWTARPLASELPKLCHCLSLALNNAVAVAFKIFYSRYDNLDFYLTLQYMYRICIMSQRSSETIIDIFCKIPMFRVTLSDTIHSNSFCRESFFGATWKGSRSPIGGLTKRDNILKNRKNYEEFSCNIPINFFASTTQKVFP